MFYIKIKNKKGDTQGFALPARYKVGDVARILGVSARTVYRMINSGSLVDTKYRHVEHDARAKRHGLIVRAYFSVGSLVGASV